MTAAGEARLLALMLIEEPERIMATAALLLLMPAPADAMSSKGSLRPCTGGVASGCGLNMMLDDQIGAGESRRSRRRSSLDSCLSAVA